jgi:[acyl-carrier-protein] S-malonyltransferase
MISDQTAFIFPGQGSQSVGMGRDLAEAYPEARQVFSEADEILGFPLSKLAWDGPETDLNDTINTQPALMTHSVASLRVLQKMVPDIRPAYTAGHSMGELSALVVTGALDFSYALRLVRRRGELMKRAGTISPGGMAAVLGLDIPTLDRICAEASQPGEIVQVANDNCPGQVVISGARDALERALILCQQEKARRVIPLAVSIAAHSPLMLDAQDDFNLAVDSAQIIDPHIPIIGNVNAAPITTSHQIREDLRAQLTSRVRWTESVQYMLNQGVTTFIELGSGSVLLGLIKRIDRQAEGFALSAPADFEALPLN